MEPIKFAAQSIMGIYLDAVESKYIAYSKDEWPRPTKLNIATYEKVAGDAWPLFPEDRKSIKKQDFIDSHWTHGEYAKMINRLEAGAVLVKRSWAEKASAKNLKIGEKIETEWSKFRKARVNELKERGIAPVKANQLAQDDWRIAKERALSMRKPLTVKLGMEIARNMDQYPRYWP